MVNFYWSTKTIVLKDWFVYKTPDLSKINIDKINYSIEFFKEKFLEFIPNTKLIKKDWEYIIKQDYICWCTLKENNEYSNEQLNFFLDFINKSIYLLIVEWKFFDITWYQWNQNFMKYSWVRKRIQHFNTIKNFFNSTNFVLSWKNKAYFVDIVVSYWIYNNKTNTIYNKIYRLFVLFWYKKQILDKLKEQNKK